MFERLKQAFVSRYWRPPGWFGESVFTITQSRAVSMMMIRSIAFTGDIVVTWGDGTQETYTSDPNYPEDPVSLYHSYSQEHVSLTGERTIRVHGDITVMGVDLGPFYDGGFLRSVCVPSTVYEIGYKYFAGDSKLKHVAIMGNPQLGEEVFSGCSSLESVTVCALNPKPCSPDVFLGVPSSAVLYVPEGAVLNYMGTDGWKAFPGRIVKG